LTSALVLTGITNMDLVAEAPVEKKPDLIFKSV